MDPIRRKILKTGAAVTAMAAAPGLRTLGLESFETRAESCCRGRAGSAERLASRDADLQLRQQSDGMGAGNYEEAA